MGLLAALSPAQTPGHHDAPEVVVYHARGAWPAPTPSPVAMPRDLTRLLDDILAAAPPAVRTQRDAVWFGLADRSRPGVYQAVLMRPGVGVEQVLPDGVRELLPATNGRVAVVTPAGAVAVLGPKGALIEVAARGRTPAWDEAGTELLFVAESAPQAGGPHDPTALCAYRVDDGKVRELSRGHSDYFPVANTKTGDVLFASGRARTAAFWLLRAGTKEPVQVCNFGTGMDASFVPMPCRTPFFDAESGRFVYELDYGDGPEVWTLDVTAHGAPSATGTRIGRGSGLAVRAGVARFFDADRGEVEVVLANVATESTDFGLRKDGDATAQRLGQGPTPTQVGLFSPLKVEFPLIYNAYKCNTGLRNAAGHPGHDFDAPRFTQQYAAGDGRVTEWQDGWGAGTGPGNFVTIEHDWLDRSTIYWHLQAGTVWPAPPDAFVGVGMPIGRTGDSGDAHQVPHVHFGVFDVDWFTRNWNDPTGFYAVNKIGGAPDRYAPSWRSPGSCGIVQLPIPDYVRFPGIDTLPPTFTNPRVVRVQDLGRDVMLHFEVDIADHSGVFDEVAMPTLQNPNARGVYLVVNPIEFANATVRVPMSLASGNRFSGTYRTDYPMRVRKGRASGAPDVDLLTYTFVAEDEALRNIAWRGIGNGGYSTWYSLTEIGDGDADSVVADVPMVDLSVEIADAPTRIAANVPFGLSVVVRNRSRFDYHGGYFGTAALNPLRDLSHMFLGQAWVPCNPYHIDLGAPFAIPALRAGASTVVHLGPYTLGGPLLFAPQNLVVSLDAPNDPEPGNSAARRTVPVVPTLPDLVIEGLTTDTEIGHGERLRATGRIRNVGVAPVSGFVQIGLGLSLDRIPNNGNDIPLGLFDIDVGTLAADAARAFDVTSLVVPPSAVPGRQYLIVCVDTAFQVLELNEFNNCADEALQVVGPEVGITAVEPLSTGIGGTGSIPVRVTLHNSGRGTAAGNVHVTIANGNVVNWGDVLFQVGPGQTVQVQTTVPTPPVFSLQPGQFVMAPVVACHNFLDPIPANNCANSTVRIDFPYWDLRLSIDGPQTMGRNQWHTWRVRVHNAGNIWSEPRCVRTGISLQSGEDWGMPHFILNQCGPGPIQSKSFGSIAPGGDLYLDFGMCISGGAWVGWQNLKVGIDTFNCQPDIFPAGNFAERRVYIQ